MSLFTRQSGGQRVVPSQDSEDTQQQFSRARPRSIKAFLLPFYPWRHSREEMYQALSCFTVLQATGSWAGAWERGYMKLTQGFTQKFVLWSMLLRPGSVGNIMLPTSNPGLVFSFRPCLQSNLLWVTFGPAAHFEYPVSLLWTCSKWGWPEASSALWCKCNTWLYIYLHVALSPSFRHITCWKLLEWP